MQGGQLGKPRQSEWVGIQLSLHGWASGFSLPLQAFFFGGINNSHVCRRWFALHPLSRIRCFKLQLFCSPLSTVTQQGDQLIPRQGALRTLWDEHAWVWSGGTGAPTPRASFSVCSNGAWKFTQVIHITTGVTCFDQDSPTAKLVPSPAQEGTFLAYWMHPPPLWAAAPMEYFELHPWFGVCIFFLDYGRGSWVVFPQPSIWN